MKVIAGIDPGITGAIAFYIVDQDARVAVYDIPVAGGEICAPALASLLRQYSPSLAVLEKVGAMPGNGGVSMFNFGRSYGDVRGVIGALNIPLHYVTPGVWKKHFGLTSDKDLSRKLAIQRFPAVEDHFRRKKDDGRAEAALIALYGADVILKRAAA